LRWNVCTVDAGSIPGGACQVKGVFHVRKLRASPVGNPKASFVPSRPGYRPSNHVERLKRLQLAIHDTNTYQRRVAAKGAAAGAQPMTRLRGPPMTGGILTVVSRLRAINRCLT
jgi:hypothetical protein